MQTNNMKVQNLIDADLSMLNLSFINLNKTSIFSTYFFDQATQQLQRKYQQIVITLKTDDKQIVVFDNQRDSKRHSQFRWSVFFTRVTKLKKVILKKLNKNGDIIFPDRYVNFNQLLDKFLDLKMINIQKVLKTFAKVKPLKISVISTEPSIKVKSQTSDHQWEVKNALENVLASLVACQVSTLKDMSHRAKIEVHSIKFNKVQSSYDLANYMKGGSASKLNQVTIQAQFETSGTQADLDALHKKVQNSCPVYQMLSGAGVKIINNWKNTQKS